METSIPLTIALSGLRDGRTDHLNWYMPISIRTPGQRVLSKETASWGAVLWFAPQWDARVPTSWLHEQMASAATQVMRVASQDTPFWKPGAT